MYRQGDVLIVRTTEAVKGTDAREGGRIILAHGEVTGHAHEVLDPAGSLPAAQFFEAPDGRRFLLVEQACVLTHQEHGPIALAPGAYEVVRQREYSPEAIRNVAD